MWVDASELIDNVLKTLAFKSREEADGVEALKYALEELGHDSFGSKVFIVITAKDKQVKRSHAYSQADINSIIFRQTNDCRL